MANKWPTSDQQVNFERTLGHLRYPIAQRLTVRQRPYRSEYTGSLQNSEVNHCRARIVLRWGTAREVLRVLLALFIFWVMRLSSSARRFSGISAPRYRGTRPLSWVIDRCHERTKKTIPLTRFTMDFLNPSFSDNNLFHNKKHSH